jgi:hypothetical protein
LCKKSSLGFIPKLLFIAVKWANNFILYQHENLLSQLRFKDTKYINLIYSYLFVYLLTMRYYLISFVFFLLFSGFSFAQETVVIFSINDPHGSIDNFPRLKTLIENERALNNKVFL